MMRTIYPFRLGQIKIRIFRLLLASYNNYDDLNFVILLNTSHPSTSINDKAIQSLTLNSKPNIYLLSYDSLIPPEIIREYLQLKISPYQDVLDRHFNEYPNSLSFHVPSKQSINDVMRLGQKHNELNFLSFAGNAPSLLSSFLSRNGYELITGYKGLYFGNAGPHIDHSLFPSAAKIEASVLCISQRKLERTQAFLVCDIARFLLKNEYISFYEIIFGRTSGVIERNWHNVVLEQIQLNGLNKSPVFTYLYTYNPIGHTSMSYQHDNIKHSSDYKEDFRKNAALLAKQLTEASAQIRKYDPNSILIIFGNHGAYLSRSTKIEENTEFFIKDRHRIVIALGKTEHFCSNPENLESLVDFQTPSRIVTSLFKCLSDKKIEQLPNFNFDEDQKILEYATLPFFKS